MANEYPIRRDISQQGPSKVAPPADTQTPFQRDQAAARARSQVTEERIRRQQELVRGAPGVPGAGGFNRLFGYFADDPGTAALRAAQVQKLDALRAAPLVSDPKPAPKSADVAAKVSRDDPRRAAAVAGNARPQTDLATEAVAAILSRPWTLREGQAAVGMIPAPVKPQTNTDRAVGVGLDFTMGNYMSQIDAIRNSGVSAADQAKAEQSAAKELTNTLIAITRGNPMNLAGAGIYDQEGQ